jgi:AAA family ATP:ADP antiporter
VVSDVDDFAISREAWQMSFVKRFFGSILSVEPQERLKLMFLSAAYFFVITGYTITRDLRDTVFSKVVGADYQPLARMLSLFALILPLFLYSKMVDRLRRYQLLIASSLVYGIGGLAFAYFLGSPGIGMPNTKLDPYRFFGWLFYFFIEAYSPFVVSVFWAFANSISDQDAAKKNYGIMVAGSKVGGILASLFSMAVLGWHTAQNTLAVDVIKHQILLAVASIASLCIPVCVLLLMRKVPGRYLHGYEAVYKLEKERQKQGKSENGIWSGLVMLFDYPYVMGMFCIVFFYELVNTVLGFQRILIAESHSSSASGMSVFLYETTLIMHVLGLFISLFGTRWLIEKFGEKICLMLVPAVNFALLLYFMASRTAFAFVVAAVVTKAVHYALSYPLKESLYIPTVKEIKFKSKSWIDTFGQKFARSTGSVFNWIVARSTSAVFFSANLIFIGAITGLWFVVAYFLGRKYETAIENNEVIGAQQHNGDSTEDSTAA